MNSSKAMPLQQTKLPRDEDDSESSLSPSLLSSCCPNAYVEMVQLDIMGEEPSKSPEATKSDGGCGCSYIKEYLGKFAGAGVAGTPPPPLTQTGFSCLGSFTGIAALGLIHTYLLPAVSSIHLVTLVGSFGAQAVIIFSLPKVPVAQPKNAIIGNGIGAIVGVTVVKATEFAGLGHMLWLSAALAVSLTIAFQEFTASVHPPGGATALLYVIIPPLQSLGYIYVLCPILTGTLVMVVIGMVANNLSSVRAYPQGWWCLENDQPLPEVEPSPIMTYLKKFAGAGVAGPPPPPLTQTGFSCLGSFTGIAALGLIQTYVLPAVFSKHLMLLVGSFGAMAVIIFSLPGAPVAQPKNSIIGNSIGGIAGVIVVKAMELAGLGHMLWLSAALAVSLTIALQEMTATVNPPGGATALIFVLKAFGAPKPLPQAVIMYEMGKWYVFCPACLGALILVAIGMMTNNLSQTRTYPQGWW